MQRRKACAMAMSQTPSRSADFPSSTAQSFATWSKPFCSEPLQSRLASDNRRQKRSVITALIALAATRLWHKL
jgi:hypothetical protein